MALYGPQAIRAGEAKDVSTMRYNGYRATPPEEGYRDAMADRGQGWTGEQQRQRALAANPMPRQLANKLHYAHIRVLRSETIIL
jgi:hypothetical protein